MHKRDRTEWSASGKRFCQFCTGRFFDFNASETLFHIMSLYFSTWPFPEGLYGVVRLVATPLSRKKVCTSLLKNEAPRSEWMYAGMPNIENILVKDTITLCADTSVQGNTNGNLENSSIAHKK